MLQAVLSLSMAVAVEKLRSSSSVPRVAVRSRLAGSDDWQCQHTTRCVVRLDSSTRQVMLSLSITVASGRLLRLLVVAVAYFVASTRQITVLFPKDNGVGAMLASRVPPTLPAHCARGILTQHHHHSRESMEATATDSRCVSLNSLLYK